MKRPHGLLVTLLAVGALAAAGLRGSDPAAGARDGAPPRRVLLEKDEAYARSASALRDSGIKILGDYGRLVLAELTGVRARRALDLTGVRVRRELPEGVKLRRRVVTRGDGSGGPEGTNLYLVRPRGPARPSWVESLHGTPGVRVLAALPESAYLAWLPQGPGPLLASLPERPEIVTPLQPSDRISPDLDGAADPLEVNVYFVATPGGRAAVSAARDRSFGSPGLAPQLPGLTGEAMTLSRQDLEEIASWKELAWAGPFQRPVMHDEVSSLLTAGRLDQGRPMGPHYRQWLSLHGLDDLSSWIVQVVDTGIDSGLAGDEHPALEGRLSFALDETGGDGAEDCVGHGTHIAGIIAGDPPPGFDLADEDGYQFGLGLAPTARLGASRIFTCDGGISAARPYSEILGEAWQLGARISNNSWGGSSSSYTALARVFDGLVRDANGDPSDGDQPMVVVASSGNSGPQPLTIGSPSLAKNVIAVGGTESYRPEGTDGCGGGPSDADDPAIIRRSSSRGPTTDGRIKPDVVAPGSHILSTVSQSEKYTGLGLCDTFYPPGQRLYSWTSGTSQSAAHVSGAAVLMMEDYRRQFGAIPSPAMVKAGLVATARDLGDPNPATGEPILSRPAGSQGWGRVDLGNLVGHRLRAAFDQAGLFTSAGQEAVHGPFLVADPNRPVSVVLAWTDAPGSPAASSWVNDLDLEVTASGTAYLGNVMEDGFSVPGGVPDGRNNLEAVFLEPGAASTVTARVMAVSLPGDGVPSAAGATDQDYALYIDNVIAPAPSGGISLDRTDYSCSDTALALVTDRSVSGGGRVHVEAASSSESTPEILELFEDPPGTGIFMGAIPLEAGPPGPDGIVQVSDGDTLTVTYSDNDLGDGTAGQIAATATTHCTPLVISGVQVDSIGEETAIVTWTTSRPADSVVTGSPGIDERDPSLVTEHRVILRDLTSCAFHAFRVSSTDAGGATAEAPATGSMNFNTTAGLTFPLFHNDFEGSRAPWSHSGTGDEWELGSPLGGPGSAASGTRAWGTDLDGPYAEDADITLRMPPVQLHRLRDATLSFRHSLDIPLALSPGDPQDGAWVEGSIDGGVTWIALGPAGGYPAVAGPGNPYVPASSGVFAGSTGWAEARFDLSPLLGGEVLIRFRLWRDPDSGIPPGAGWFIDDVTVEAAFPCGTGTLTLDAPTYGCSAVAAIRLADADVDVDPQRTGLASVTAEGPSGSLGVQLTETASDSRVYSGSVNLTSGSSPGFLTVAEGDRITIRFQDADDGTGAATVVEVGADVTDCSAPGAPSGLLVEPDGSGRLKITWNDPPAADLSEIRIHYDSDSPGPSYTGSGAIEGASPLRSEGGSRTAFLSGLPACTPHYISLTAMDLLGNESGFSTEVVGVPFAGSPCPRATIALAGAGGAGCSQSLPVRIDDANADVDLATPGSITAQATSASASSPLTVTLVETGPDTGTFTGLLPLTASPTAGKLQVIEGDTVVLTYDDLDTGGGTGLQVSSSVPVDDCGPPQIGGIRLTHLGFDCLGLEWTTDEPAGTLIEYGMDPGLESSIALPPGAMVHTAELPLITSCSTVFYRITATDSRGNTSVADDAGLPFRVGSGRELVEFFDDLESGGPGWTTAGVQNEWELGVPVAGPPPPPSGASVWGTDLDGTYEPDADMTLTTPLIDLSGLDRAFLTFRHWYEIYTDQPGTGAGFDDGGWVEVSRDGGATWVYVTPDGGYPDRIANNPYLLLGTPVYAGETTSGWEPALFNLDAFAGDRILVRFHLFQDRLDPPGSALGWYLDDVEVRAAAPCHQARVHLAADGGDCGRSPMAVLVWDSDLDQDPLAPETTVVRLTSPSDPGFLDVTVTETGPASGEFTGPAPFAPAGGPGILQVTGGDLVTATYNDADDGTGNSRIATGTALIGDCTPPLITGVRTQRISLDEILVEWETDEPSDSEIMVTPGGLTFSSPVMVTQHSLKVSGLPACTAHQFLVASTDTGGNRVVDDNGGALFPVEAAREIVILSEGFESGASGWEHFGDPDEWEFGPPVTGPPAAFQGASVAGTDLDGTYHKDRLRQGHEAYLVSPPVSLAGLSTARLSFQSFHEFALDTRGDGGRVEVLDGGRWEPVTPAGGYPGELRTDRGGGSEPAFVEESGGWVFSGVDLSPYLGRSIRIRFSLIVDHGTPLLRNGWYLDEVRVTGTAPCRRGIVQLDRDGYGCGPGRAGVLLSDDDLNLDAQAVDSVQVAATAGSASVSVLLTETGDSTGLFSGEILLDPSGGSGGLQVSSGETLSVSYDDADDGSGLPATASAAAPVNDCEAPGLLGIRVEYPGGGSTVQVRWETAEPATTEVTLTPQGAPPLEVTDPTLATDHVATFHRLPPCVAFSIVVASRDELGNRAVASGGALPFAGEARAHQIIFSDDMEGLNPGWLSTGNKSEWERGEPEVGPPGPLSGLRAFGTDLDGLYEAGADASLTSPVLDLSGVSSATLTFWHYFEIFGDGTPNADDDGGWIEVLRSGSPQPAYVIPQDGYNNTIDRDGNPPLTGGAGVFAGDSEAWIRSTVDLTPFAGRLIQLRFNLWNDILEGVHNRLTGVGWYIDDVEVTAPGSCFPAPTLTSITGEALVQGRTDLPLTVSGSGLRSPLSFDAGPGLSFHDVVVEGGQSASLLADVSPGAATGDRALKVFNPDGQSAALPGGLQIVPDPRRADIDGSGVVDGKDLAILAAAFGTFSGDSRYRADADLDGDGSVDGSDLAILAARFGTIVVP